MTEKEQCISVVQAPREYQVDRATVYRWIAAERLTPVKFPRDRLTYVRREELERLLKEEHQGPGRPGHWRKPPDDRDAAG